LISDILLKPKPDVKISDIVCSAVIQSEI